MKTLIMFTLAAAMARGCANDYSYDSPSSHVWTPPGEDAWLRDSAPPVETRPAAPIIAQAPLIPEPPPPPPVVRAPEPRKLEPAAPIIPEPVRVTTPTPAPKLVEPASRPVEPAPKLVTPAPKPIVPPPQLVEVTPPKPVPIPPPAPKNESQPPRIELPPSPPAPVKPPSKFAKMTMTAVGSSLIFFDQETGNIWAYDNPEEPAILIGKFESFDRPLISEAIKRAYEERSAKKNPPAAKAAVLPDKPAVKARDDRPIAEKLNDLPKTLWYSTGENEVKRHAREKWLDENIKPGKEKFTGKLSSVSMVKDGKGGEVVRARMEVEKVRIWEQELTLYVTATLNNLRPADVINWQRGQLMMFSGEVTEAKPELSQFGGGYFGVEVRLDHASVEK